MYKHKIMEINRLVEVHLNWLSALLTQVQLSTDLRSRRKQWHPRLLSFATTTQYSAFLEIVANFSQNDVVIEISDDDEEELISSQLMTDSGVKTEQNLDSCSSSDNEQESILGQLKPDWLVKTEKVSDDEEEEVLQKTKKKLAKAKRFLEDDSSSEEDDKWTSSEEEDANR